LQDTGYGLRVEEFKVKKIIYKILRMNSYRELEIYQMAYKLAIKVHKMTMQLPQYEMYEQGSQIRRSTKSIKDNIAEGYGRRRYKNDFVRFLVSAHASCDEAHSQLTMIDEIHYESKGLLDLISEYEILGKKLNRFLDYVEKNWNENL
jgi:four helix bundle protein